MMTRLACAALVLVILPLLLMIACSGQPAENPFRYPFIKPLHLKRESDKPYSSYKAFYVLTEDFEPRVGSAPDIDSVREVLKFASRLSSEYKVSWTHFVDVNALAPGFVSDDNELKQRCQSMIGDLKAMAGAGDDCELHLHGPMRPELLDYLGSEEKLRIKESGAAEEQPYRQRKSFFFQSFYRQGYRQMVASLSYGKRLLEKAVNDGKKQVVAFRPGGWDHGSNSQDAFLYFCALSDTGLIANSGLTTGNFGGRNWRVGNDPGHNLATVSIGEKTLLEVSPTAGPGGYLNPVLPNDLNRLASSVRDEMPVIVAVYHLGALQKISGNSDSPPKSDAEIGAERDKLEQHFKTVGDLRSAKVLYPITLRQLLSIISEQQ